MLFQFIRPFHALARSRHHPYRSIFQDLNRLDFSDGEIHSDSLGPVSMSSSLDPFEIQTTRNYSSISLILSSMKISLQL